QHMRLIAPLIGSLIGLRSMDTEISSDLTDKEGIMVTRKALGYIKGGHRMDIGKLQKYHVVQAAAHLLTKLNDQERWSQ
ncbi:hypothetical protein KI387_025166, partial [Taxus chinensis]